MNAIEEKEIKRMKKAIEKLTPENRKSLQNVIAGYALAEKNMDNSQKGA